jgi:hypothetical protein
MSETQTTWPAGSAIAAVLDALRAAQFPSSVGGGQYRPPAPMPQPVEAPPPAQSGRPEVDPIFGLDLSKYRRQQGDIDPITGLDLSKY